MMEMIKNYGDADVVAHDGEAGWIKVMVMQRSIQMMVMRGVLKMMVMSAGVTHDVDAEIGTNGADKQMGANDCDAAEEVKLMMTTIVLQMFAMLRCEQMIVL